MNVGELLRGNARRCPNRFAINELTYAELLDRAARVAGGLASLGIGKGHRVALAARNGLPWAETYWAATLLGAVAVPVNPVLSREEQDYILHDCAVSAVLADGAELRTPGGSVPYDQLLGHAPADSEGLSHEIVPSDPHSICYTSGTTGRPKGAVLTHSNILLSQFNLQAVEYGLTREDVFLISTPLCHRTGWGRLIVAAGLGARVALLPRFDPAAMLRAIRVDGVTVIGIVPTVLRRLVPLLDQGGYDTSGVRILLLTGEGCPPATLAELQARFPRATIYNFYSSTEAGTVAIYRPEDRAGLIPGVHVRLLTDDDSDAAPGEVGRIAVWSGPRGSFTVMAGYFGRPEADQAAFRHGDWFLTGDLGRWSADGRLELVGRTGDTIISGGLNIYPREVENCLLTHPAVAEAAVLGAPDPEWGESVHAYVVLHPGASCGAEELVAHCREHLAGYKKPRRVSFLPELPKNASGKVQKSCLREQAGERMP